MWALELEDQLANFAKRVAVLNRRNTALIKLLRSIKRNGGCGEAHWRVIEKILHREDSGRAIRIDQRGT
jgi:hypothetical protein